MMAKIVITVFVVTVGLLIIFGVKSTPGNAGPRQLWQLREADPVRGLLFDKDGSLRRHAKLVLGVIWLLWLVFFWLFA